MRRIYMYINQNLPHNVQDIYFYAKENCTLILCKNCYIMRIASSLMCSDIV